MRCESAHGSGPRRGHGRAAHVAISVEGGDEELEAAVPVREEEHREAELEHADRRRVELDELLLPPREVAEEAGDAQQPEQLDQAEDAQQREGLGLQVGSGAAGAAGAASKRDVERGGEVGGGAVSGQDAEVVCDEAVLKKPVEGDGGGEVEQEPALEVSAGDEPRIRVELAVLEDGL